MNRMQKRIDDLEEEVGRLSAENHRLRMASLSDQPGPPMTVWCTSSPRPMSPTRVPTYTEITNALGNR